MGTLAGTVIIDYRLSFADQGKQTTNPVSICIKQTEVYRFCFPFAANKQKFTVSVFR
jgi:hypothetical protein